MEKYKQFFDQLYELDLRIHSPSKSIYEWTNICIPEDVVSILDVGCGKGNFLDSLTLKYIKVGIDFSYTAFKEYRNFHAAVGRIEALPFKSSSFTLVTCFEVLEHLSYQSYCRAIGELERISSKYIIASVPNRQILNELLVTCPKCLCKYNPDWHVRAFDKISLENLFSNFAMITCTETGPIAMYHNSKLFNVYNCLRTKKPPATSVCPQCAFSPIIEFNIDQQSSGYFKKAYKKYLSKNNFLRIFGKIFFLYEERPYWLLATYERKFGQ